MNENKEQGDILIEQKKYKEAIESYTKAIELHGNYKEAYKNRGVAYYYQGIYEEAIKDCTKAIEIDENYKFAYNNRGNAYYKQGKYEEAIKDYTKAIDLDPNYKRAYNNRSFAYIKNGESEKAKQDKNMVIFLDVKEKDEKFYKYIKKINIAEDKRVQISELFLSVMKLKDELLYDDEKSVRHYTKIGNLKYLLKPQKIIDKDNIIPRLRLNNVAYMNDPTEGEVFIKLLKKYSDGSKELIDNLYKDKNKYNRQVLKGKNHTFLASFSNSIDTSLPMWVQYTDDGQGCCLVFEHKFFDENDKNPLNLSDFNENQQLSETDSVENELQDNKLNKKYYCLYNIKYVNSKNNDDYYIDDEKDNIKDLLKDISKKIMVFKSDIEKEDNPENKSEKESNTSIKEIIQNLLDQVRFLFKDINYEHEKEVRLVKFEDNGDVKYTGDAEGFRVPHVYIDLEKDLKVEEVILGPKVEKPIEIANYLYYTGKVDKVSKSKIKYQ